MSSQLPSNDKVLEQAARGEPIGENEVAILASEEADLTGGGPAKGGAAATSQSLHDKQQNFINTAGAVLRKPPGSITAKDAKDVRRTEQQARGGVKPGEGSVSADISDAAESNAKQGFV